MAIFLSALRFQYKLGHVRIHHSACSLRNHSLRIFAVFKLSPIICFFLRRKKIYCGQMKIPYFSSRYRKLVNVVSSCLAEVTKRKTLYLLWCGKRSQNTKPHGETSTDFGKATEMLDILIFAGIGMWREVMTLWP